MDVGNVAPFSNVSCPTCGKHTRVKREFGPYSLVRRHAVGGMSMVFVARDETLDREVALKILSEEFSGDGRRIAAFEEEARITASFSHPHVVRVLTTGKAFGRLYIAMELVPGGHFEHQIRERGKIPEVEMLPLAIQVAEGLKAAHAAGLIHRDIKPGNILLDAEGHAKIVDFGLSLVTQGGMAQATEIWATPYYVPPETIEGDAEDFRSDIYAFGATLYHALAGVPPCDEESMGTNVLREAKMRIVPLGEVAPDLSTATCAIVDRAMAYSPEDRFASYDEMILALHSALKRLSSGAAGDLETSGSAARRRELKKRKERLSIAAAALVMAAGVTFGIWWVTRDDTRVKPAKGAPVVVGEVVADPGSGNGSATEIARSYRAARAAVEARQFKKAASEFSALLENPSVQEPTRTWAGVEAVVAGYLDGESATARTSAGEALEHVGSLAGGEPELDASLIRMLERTRRLPAISPKDLESANVDAARVMAWMLAGLKDWEQGLTNEAATFFQAVSSAKLPADDGWLEIYQNLARDYLADHGVLSGEVFRDYPADVAGCESAVSQLDQLVQKLKTRGRAKFNVRAWQLELAKRAKLLASAGSEAASSAVEPVELPEVMAKLEEFAGECRFGDAVTYLKSLNSDPVGATRASLLSVTEACVIFLSDLEADLGKRPAAGEFLLRSGEIVSGVSMKPDGGITAVADGGGTRLLEWGDFSADAMIALHKIFVADLTSGNEQVRRHGCAISYDWLAGNRERALAAAAVLSKGSPEFRQRWESISGGLPE